MSYLLIELNYNKLVNYFWGEFLVFLGNLDQKPVEQVKSTRIEYFLKVRVLHDNAENRVSSSTE